MGESKIYSDSIMTEDDYNAIPVTYCKNCLSLKIMVLDEDESYCDDCGCTDVESTDITSWEKMYETKYNKHF